MLGPDSLPAIRVKALAPSLPASRVEREKQSPLSNIPDVVGCTRRCDISSSGLILLLECGGVESKVSSATE